MRDLNRAYAAEPALHELDNQPGGFDWIDAGVGASFALLIAFLVGASVLASRHLRSGPLPH